jgi:NAD(P)-dependent dehydrogenase (short-subunit alcohol dehydrogenase family)
LTNNLFSIKDKVIIITGASKGIGSHLAINLAKESAIVYGLSRTLTMKNNMQKNLHLLKCDITNKKKLQKIYRAIFSKHGRIDVLINNAGISMPKKKSRFYPKKYWQKTLDINLTAAFNCSQEVIKYMLKNKSGSIINMTSINAELAFPNNPAYVSSKGALKMLGKSLARDWGKFGIRVNNLGPGYIKTKMTLKSYDNYKKRLSRENQTMLSRWGTPSDLLGPCVFLCSDASKYITSQDIYVDGGWVANGLPQKI